jgi:hypothetical protein
MKNYFKYLRIIILLLSLSSSLKAQMEISGFFDAVGALHFPNTKETGFLINQFEVDLSYLHKSRFSVGSAVAYNNETENMELAMAFIHYSFDDGPAKHPRRLETYDHSAIMVGKFDMPFGLDYLSYASVDRPTYTQPLVIEKTIAGWNDIGIDYHLFAGNFKFDVWTVNGFRDGVGIGGNIRYRVFPFLEIGTSHSVDVNNFQKLNDWLSGVDLMINTNILQVKSEFMWMEGVYEGIPDSVLNNNMHYGGYLQVLTEFNEWLTVPLFLTLRFGGWRCSGKMNEIDETEYRYTATLGYGLHENLSLRLEASVNTYNHAEAETLGILQIIVSF